MMMDKQLTDLKKKLAELSQKSPQKKKAPEVPEPTPVPEATPVPEPTPEPIEDLNTDEMDLLTKQIAKMEEKVPQETEGSEEEVKRFQQLQVEIERLQNDGVFRVELIFQLVRIGNALERLGGENAKK